MLYVVSRLRNILLDGEIPAGALIPDRDLCTRLQISRTPLREALKALAAEGLVLLLPNRGSRAAKLTSKDVQHCSRFARVLNAWPASSPANVSPTRSLPRSARCTAQHYHDRDLQLHYPCNRQIHEAIVDAARNPVLSALYESVTARIRRARFP